MKWDWIYPADKNSDRTFGFIAVFFMSKKQLFDGEHKRRACIIGVSVITPKFFLIWLYN